MRVIPRTAVINEAEAKLTNALVAVVGGTMPMVTPATVHQHLSRFFQVEEHEVQVHRSKPDDFLLLFNNERVMDRVLHTVLPRDMELILVFWIWCHESRVLLSALRYKVLLAIDNIPLHAWSTETAQDIIGLAYRVFELAPSMVNKSDMTSFMVVVWVVHPDLIPREVGCIIPEPEESFIEGKPPPVLDALEIIHYKRHTLQFQTPLHILEVHDFSLPSELDEDFPGRDVPDSSDDSGDDDYPGYDPGHSSLCPWPGV
jgi:hypothetical protein